MTNTAEHSWDLSKIQKYQASLLNWYSVAGRHDLPWKSKEYGLYEIWLSEIMLQQTQVKTVLPYFKKFLQHFPNIHALASASIDEVLMLWSGLGYYSRAHNLQKAAQMIMQEHQGQFPTQLEQVLALPGVGPSTAAAILAQGKNAPYAILDGNVRRILTRLFEIHGTGNQLEKQLWPIAQSLTPQKAADYTQAIMDLGASICKKKPLCAECPVQAFCNGYKNSSYANFPNPKPKKLKPKLTRFYLFLQHDSEKNAYILLEKRPNQGIWKGLWSLPEVSEPFEIAAYLHQYYSIKNVQIEIIPKAHIEHTFSHFHLTLIPVICTIKDQQQAKTMNAKKINAKSDLTRIGLAKPIHDLIKRWQITQKATV